MSNYARNKERSRTINMQPSMTDQSAAKETDRTVIVQKFMQHGQLPTGNREPIYADFSRLPRGLQGLLKQAQSVGKLRGSLPPQLRELTMEALLSLTTEQLNQRLKPAEPPPKKDEGEKK